MPEPKKSGGSRDAHARSEDQPNTSALAGDVEPELSAFEVSEEVSSHTTSADTDAEGMENAALPATDRQTWAREWRDRLIAAFRSDSPLELQAEWYELEKEQTDRHSYALLAREMRRVPKADADSIVGPGPSQPRIKPQWLEDRPLLSFHPERCFLAMCLHEKAGDGAGFAEMRIEYWCSMLAHPLHHPIGVSPEQLRTFTLQELQTQEPDPKFWELIGNTLAIRGELVDARALFLIAEAKESLAKIPEQALQIGWVEFALETAEMIGSHISDAQLRASHPQLSADLWSYLAATKDRTLYDQIANREVLRGEYRVLERINSTMDIPTPPEQYYACAQILFQHDSFEEAKRAYTLGGYHDQAEVAAAFARESKTSSELLLKKINRPWRRFDALVVPSDESPDSPPE